jgi:hypothetical protein
MSPQRAASFQRSLSALKEHFAAHPELDAARSKEIDPRPTVARMGRFCRENEANAAPKARGRASPHRNSSVAEGRGGPRACRSAILGKTTKLAIKRFEPPGRSRA